MEKFKDKKTRNIIISEEKWNDFHLRFFFWQIYLHFLENMWIKPEDIFKEKSDFFNKNLKWDTYICFVDENERKGALDYLKKSNFPNFDKAEVFTTKGEDFSTFERVFY